MPEKFNTEPAPEGDILMYPQGDRSAPPCARMPRDGFYFDTVTRQPPIDENKLNVEDNLEAGFDVLNPVQTSAAGVDPGYLKETYGDRIVLWGGGVDTQKTLPFGSPEEVAAEVRERLEIFSVGGGCVFNAIHNIQANTPPENLLALVEALRASTG